MVFLGKNLIMSIVASIGYCIEVVGKEGQGEVGAHLLSQFLPGCCVLAHRAGRLDCVYEENQNITKPNN